MKKLVLLAAMLVVLGFSALGNATLYYYTIDYPGSLRTNVYGINDAGTMVGEYYDGTITHGFLYNGSNFITLDYPFANYLTSLSGINNAGQIVGSYMMSDHTAHGFIYDGVNFNEIGTGGTALRGINDSGQIVGRVQTVGGFLYEAGIFTPINGSNPRGIDNLGHIVGENGSQYGFLEYGATFNIIEYPGGVLRTEAAGINDAGLIAGYYSSDDLNVRHGFVYNGSVYSTLDYPAATSTFLYDINNAGQIVATITLDGIERGALISPFEVSFAPVPEPTTMLLLGLGLIGLAGMRRRMGI